MGSRKSQARLARPYFQMTLKTLIGGTNVPFPIFQIFSKKCLEFRRSATKRSRVALLPLRLPRITADASQKCL